MLLIALLFIAETSGDLACGQPYFGGLNPSTVSNLKTPKDSTGIVIPTGLTPQNFVYASSQGYDLPVKNLPWGVKPYTVTRYRIDASHNLDQVDRRKELAVACISLQFCRRQVSN